MCSAALGWCVLYVHVRTIGLKYGSSPTLLIHFLSGCVYIVESGVLNTLLLLYCLFLPSDMLVFA